MLLKHITQSFIKPTQIYGNNLFNNFININKQISFKFSATSTID
jgi:hypothetical protein